MARAAYRSRQVWHALRPRLGAADLAPVYKLLDPPARGLFFAMERRDQRHCLEVMRRLQAGRTDDPDLLRAALLHDCAKGAVPVWLRIARVLSPALVRRAGAEDAPGWRGAAFRLSHDAALGAILARQAGLNDRVVRLISGRVAPEEQEQLAQLMAADDAS